MMLGQGLFITATSLCLGVTSGQLEPKRVFLKLNFNVLSHDITSGQKSDCGDGVGDKKLPVVNVLAEAREAE